jgi:hypothetical protein
MQQSSSSTHNRMELLQQGAEPPVLTLWVGYTPIETTQIYLDVSLELKRRDRPSRREAGAVSTREQASCVPREPVTTPDYVPAVQALVLNGFFETASRDIIRRGRTKIERVGLGRRIRSARLCAGNRHRRVGARRSKECPQRFLKLQGSAMFGLGDVRAVFEQAASLKPTSQLRGRGEFIAGVVRHTPFQVPLQVDRIHEVVEQREVAGDSELFGQPHRHQHSSFAG